MAMKIRFFGGGFIGLGPNRLGPFEPNKIITLPNDSAESLVRAGLAEPVNDRQQISISVNLNLTENFSNSEEGKLL